MVKANRFTLILLFVSALPFVVGAQLRFNVYSAGYFNITDYSGYISPEGSHQFHIQYDGTFIEEHHWGIKARLNGPIRPISGNNVSGQSFPAEKIRFRFTHDDGNHPTLAAIGASMANIPLNAAAETPLIPKSNAAISHRSQYHSHMQFHLYFAVDIEGGDYLNRMRNSEAYQMIVYAVPLTFTLYRADGTILGYQDAMYYIQVNQTLSGGPTVTEFSLEVLGNARNCTLELGSPRHYTEGISLVNDDGLRVNSSTAYAITARTIGPELTQTTGGQASIPVGAIKLRLQPGSLAPSGGAYQEIPLSVSNQSLFGANSGHSSARLFDIVYRIDGNDNRLLNAVQGVYTTTIIYQLMPR
ncbi:hypothetical protein [Olivibacter sp. XZL3]|uniref:hypothetical protein n=1 Tax=Olivibacter sp. XZL3 TaxID=1735116 RepID=UPI0010655C05|nr:hypothetical protein [Olivibacter sp. XZL3]